MSRALEVLLLGDFRLLAKVYMEAFPYSYAKYHSAPVDFQADLEIYIDRIMANREAIFRGAAWGISGYSALYKVMAVESFDEFKTIYFLGRSIERHLLEAKHVQIAQIHMFTMIGLLDRKLQSLGISKENLTRAMTRLIRVSRLDQELGTTGCYLIYKCISTTPRHLMEPGSP